MARGKKYNDDIKERAFALLSCNNSVAAVAKELGLKYTTVKTWEQKFLAQSEALAKKDEASGNEEKQLEQLKPIDTLDLVKVRNEKKREFIDDSWRLIDKVKSLLERRLDRAVENEDAIDAILTELEEIDPDDMTDTQRKAIMSKVSVLKLENIRELSVLLGTLYDKQALANREATAIVDGDITVKKFEDM